MAQTCLSPVTYGSHDMQLFSQLEAEIHFEWLIFFIPSDRWAHLRHWHTVNIFKSTFAPNQGPPQDSCIFELFPSGLFSHFHTSDYVECMYVNKIMTLPCSLVYRWSFLTSALCQDMEVNKILFHKQGPLETSTHHLTLPECVTALRVWCRLPV